MYGDTQSTAMYAFARINDVVLTSCCFIWHRFFRAIQYRREDDGFLHIHENTKSNAARSNAYRMILFNGPREFNA